MLHVFKRVFILSFVLSIVPLGITDQAVWAQNKAAQLDYTLWADVLAKHVNAQGLFDYEGLLKDRSKFDQFLKQVRTANLKGMSKAEEKAFWINAYNALTVNLILEHYPLKLGGIRTINWGRPWSIKMDVANRKHTLGEIEHEILRKWDPIDPRIHFAINCASIGCPKLPNTPFYPKTLDQQLDFETKRFINDKEKVRIDRGKNILYYSAILKWFDEDFLAVSPDLKAYILKYIKDPDKTYIKSNKLKLKTLKYDWGLNKK